MPEAWNEENAPNVVHLNLPRDSHNEGAAWVYLPSKDTIYIGPQGSYHVDITHSLKTLVDKKKGEKPITGVLYNDGYADYFDKGDEKTINRIISALQHYHETNYSTDFNKAEDDAGAWDGHDMIYPSDEDYEDPDEKARGGLDYHNPEDDLGDDDVTNGGYDSMGDYWDAQAWGTGDKKYKNQDEYKELKPTPGQPKPIHEWDTQDYLDWRDKKYWNSGGYFATPREDYPHFRWSYGDSKIMPGCPHEGLWVWPTHNGYPDHFSQTGHKGLGNCAQGRIYPHEGDRWEILTWPGRPRNAPSEATRQYIQKEAEQAVKEYVMEKIGVPEDKIFFTNMHYTSAVTMYNSPSYPDDDYSSALTTYKPRDFHYDWEPLEDWKSIPEGTWNALKDPSGREWQLSSLPPDKPGNIRLYAIDQKDPRTYEVDPSKDYTAGWEFGKKVYEDEPEDTGTENPYAWKPEDDVTDPNVSIEEAYNRIKQRNEPPANSGAKQVGPPQGALKNPDEYHKNPDGTYSRLVYLEKGPNKGNAIFNWDGSRWSWQALSPEETYATKVRWFEEDEAKRKDIARKLWPEAFGDTGDELDENGELIPPQQPDVTEPQDDQWFHGSSVEETWHEGMQLVSFRDPTSNNVIHVSPEDYELTFRLHGENWWKSFVPNRNLSSEKDLWTEVI